MTPGTIRFHDLFQEPDTFLPEVLEGLGASPKHIAPKFFYDAAGSRLFEEICDLPEYYLTRTEMGILTERAAEITALIGPDCLLIELGSGNSRKVRLLLEALRPAAYLAMDISRDHLLGAARLLAADYPWLEVHAACVDYTHRLTLPFGPEGTRRIAFFPGSSVGNFEPQDTVGFLRDVAHALQPDGALLVGVDLKKDPQVLHAAYNDSRGVTARFNLNLLARINRELGGGFVLDDFRHSAFYDTAQGRIEMHLVSQGAQTVRVAGQCFRFASGETIHTENSYKYGLSEFQDLARMAGLHPVRAWTDSRELFSVHYLSAAPA